MQEVNFSQQRMELVGGTVHDKLLIKKHWIVSTIASVNLAFFLQGHAAKMPCNAAAKREIDGICLGTVEDNTLGGHESLNLNTKRCHTQGQVTLTLAPNEVAKKAEALAAKDGMQRLKFVAWLIAGVNTLSQHHGPRL